MIFGDKKKFAASLSVTSNTLIIILKSAAGIISGSMSIISEAVHSFADLLASIITFFAVSRSSVPADKDHRFGHGKYEDFSGFIEGALIILAGIYIIIEASKKLIEGTSINNEPVLGILVMAFSSLANLFVSNYLLKVSKECRSVSLYADAQHLRTDIFSSFGIMLGLIFIKITGLAVIDTIIALIVAAIILKTGFSITKETLNDLLDGSLPAADTGKIEKILETNESIKGYKNLRTRKMGHFKNIEVTLFFNPESKISECHKICDMIEREIGKVLPDTTVSIHAEPAKQEESECKIVKG